MLRRCLHSKTVLVHPLHVWFQLIQWEQCHVSIVHARRLFCCISGLNLNIENPGTTSQYNYNVHVDFNYCLNKLFRVGRYMHMFIYSVCTSTWKEMYPLYKVSNEATDSNKHYQECLLSPALRHVHTWDMPLYHL